MNLFLRFLLIVVMLFSAGFFLYSCNEDLGQPADERYFQEPGGDYIGLPPTPNWTYYIEQEADVSVDSNGIPIGGPALNDTHRQAEHIGIDPAGANIAPEENGSIIAVKGTIAGVTGQNYIYPDTPTTFKKVELRQKYNNLICRENTTTDPELDYLYASPDDYFVVNTGVHFKNRFKTNGFAVKLEWNSQNAKLASFHCNQTTAKWEFIGEKPNLGTNPISDRDINLDVYLYLINADLGGDLQVCCETEGYRRYPETCDHYPDVFYGPWKNFDLLVRVSLYADEFEWSFGDTSGNIIYDIPYNFQLVLE